MIQENKSLVGLQTFGLKAVAKQFAEIGSVLDLQKLIQQSSAPIMILGGGSNILFAHDYTGLLIQNKIKGIDVIREFKHKVHVRVGAGEIWDQFVQWAVDNNLGGLENLSLIPGTVGASPIQNIGAYGIEIKDTFVSCAAIDLVTGKKRTFNKGLCRFGYRDSIFKHELKGKICITSVTFCLTKIKHKINTSYGDIVKQLQADGHWPEYQISHIRKAVIAIRTSKLPDPAKIGNCGSFFKNPEIGQKQFDQLIAVHPTIPGYPTTQGMVKVPAGWLIEQCGWKGKRIGNTGCYERQALVIVNYGNATGAEVQALVHDIIASIKAKFEIVLEPEVQMI